MTSCTSSASAPAVSTPVAPGADDHEVERTILGQLRLGAGIADHGDVQQYLVGRGALAALLRELHVELDLLHRLAALGLHLQPDAGRRVELHHQLDRFRLPEDQAQLGLGGWQALAGPDEERHPLPAPVVDLQWRAA
jgi:hypothetical protein